MKKYEGLRALYVGSHPLFTEGASAVHMMKMCQAMALSLIHISEPTRPY